MVETGITVDGIPLEDHLKDKKRERFFKSIEDEIQETVNTIYNTRKTRCVQRHNTRPGKVKHILKEGYMSGNLATEYEPSGCGESILAMLSTGGWWTIKMMHENNQKYGKRAYAQAALRLLERFPALVIKNKITGLQIGYSLPKIIFSVSDLMRLYRKVWTLEEMAENMPALKDWLNHGDISIPPEEPKANICFSLEQASIEICKLQQQIQEIRAEIAGSTWNSTPSQFLEAQDAGGITINIYKVDKENL